MTMVERVARAQVIAFGLNWEKMSEEPFNAGVTDHLCRAFWRVVARDAIAAMREPTEAMEKAMEKSDFEGWSPEPGEGRDYLSLTTAWEAAIDAALAEKPDEHGPPRA